MPAQSETCLGDGKRSKDIKGTSLAVFLNIWHSQHTRVDSAKHQGSWKPNPNRPDCASLTPWAARKNVEKIGPFDREGFEPNFWCKSTVGHFSSMPISNPFLPNRSKSHFQPNIENNQRPENYIGNSKPWILSHDDSWSWKHTWRPEVTQRHPNALKRPLLVQLCDLCQDLPGSSCHLQDVIVEKQRKHARQFTLLYQPRKHKRTYVTYIVLWRSIYTDYIIYLFTKKYILAIFIRILSYTSRK